MGFFIGWIFKELILLAISIGIAVGIGFLLSLAGKKVRTGKVLQTGRMVRTGRILRRKEGKNVVQEVPEEAPEEIPEEVPIKPVGWGIGVLLGSNNNFLGWLWAMVLVSAIIAANTAPGKPFLDEGLKETKALNPNVAKKVEAVSEKSESKLLRLWNGPPPTQTQTSSAAGGGTTGTSTKPPEELLKAKKRGGWFWKKAFFWDLFIALLFFPVAFSDEVLEFIRRILQALPGRIGEGGREFLGDVASKTAAETISRGASPRRPRRR